MLSYKHVIFNFRFMRINIEINFTIKVLLNMDVPEERLKADHIEVDFDTKTERNEPQKNQII